MSDCFFGTFRKVKIFCCARIEKRYPDKMSAKIQFSAVLKGQHEASLPNCIGELLKCEREPDNAYDKYAIVAKDSHERIRGRIPLHFSELFVKVMESCNASITW